MIIRRMTEADLPAVIQIDEQSFSQPWPASAYDIELENEHSRCWVAEVDGNLKALLVIWRVLDEAHIGTIAVHPTFRRRGLGRLLLVSGMRETYQEGARIYYLEVRAGNLAAQAMYINLGYDIVGRRNKYYKDNGEDALLMTLDLTQPDNPGTKLDFLSETLDDHSREPGSNRQ